MKQVLLLSAALFSLAQSSAYAGGGGPPSASIPDSVSEAALLKLRRAHVASLSGSALLGPTGECRGLALYSESKGGSLSFPVGRASPLYVNDRGINYAFDFPGGHLKDKPRRLWCMGSTRNRADAVRLTGNVHSPFWRTAVSNLGGKGQQVGRFPDVSGPDGAGGLDMYWNFAGEQYATRLDGAGQEICQGRVDPRASTPFPPAVRWVCPHPVH